MATNGSIREAAETAVAARRMRALTGIHSHFLLEVQHRLDRKYTTTQALVIRYSNVSELYAPGRCVDPPEVLFYWE